MKENYLLFETYFEKQQQITERLKAYRKARKISQERLSTISGVPYGTIRRFEKTGEISLASFLKILMGLGLNEQIDQLLKIEKHYSSIEEIINDQKD